jgi:lysophospholipase L1-like esterase
MKRNRCPALLIAVSMLLPLFGISAEPDSSLTEEFRPREGLPNVFEKIKQEGPVRIAYLGGSITAASGWRPKTLAWFQSTYPKSQFTEINAAIPGTGSDFAACRLEEDVLSHNPDLVFLECRVNGGGGVERESVEGIVRHIWKTNPQIDICFVYTISLPMLKQIQAGRNVFFGTVMEQVANRYGIPSIDLGVEVARQEKEGRLTFKADKPEKGKMLFTKDGVHPLGDGHQLYCDIITRSLLKIQNTAGTINHVLGDPIRSDCWEQASLLSIHDTGLSNGWSPVTASDDPVYFQGPRTRQILRDTVRCTRAGETLTVRWIGTSITFTDIPTVPCTVEVIVDGRQRSAFVREPKTYGIHKQTLAQYFRLPILPAGSHEAVLTVTDLPAGGIYYVGQIMVVGKQAE